jgi:hypothetical protein
VASEGLRTLYRVALQKALSSQLRDVGLEVDFQGGIIEGPQDARNIGCVWFEGKRPHSRDGNNEESFFQVRLFKLFKQDQGGTVPRVDVNADLEWTFEILEDALAAVLTRPWLATVSGEDVTGTPDFFIVTEMVMNHEQQYVQATLFSQWRNRTARGG